MAAVTGQFQKMQIVEESDSEEESAAPPAAQPETAGFKKMQIVEESDSDEEESAAPPAAQPETAGFKKMQIVEESDSDEEESSPKSPPHDVPLPPQAPVVPPPPQAPRLSTIYPPASPDFSPEAASPASESSDYTTTESESIVIVDKPTKAVTLSSGQSFHKVPNESAAGSPRGNSTAQTPTIRLSAVGDGGGDPYPELVIFPSVEGVEQGKTTGNNFFKAGEFAEAARVFEKCVFVLQGMREEPT